MHFEISLSNVGNLVTTDPHTVEHEIPPSWNFRAFLQLYNKWQMVPLNIVQFVTKITTISQTAWAAVVTFFGKFFLPIEISFPVWQAPILKRN